jgi:catechol 2,3-dioxygenase-like lactoylglutathione lyase family enzyme
MTGERTYPVLPCASIDEALAFYQALGFKVTYKQLRPNPSAVVARDDIHVHLMGIDGFDAATSYGSVIITVPDPEMLHESFTTGLREHFGKVPLKGIPRILPPRRKAGTATGFSVVDSGGNWLRFYRSGAHEETPDEMRKGLARVIDVAARQGDAHGDEGRAIAVLDAGLLRHPEAPAPDRFEAILYRAELVFRSGDDPADDLALAADLIRDHRLGSDAEQRLAHLRSETEPERK